jgi:hypothetical protein
MEVQGPAQRKRAPPWSLPRGGEAEGEAEGELNRTGGRNRTQRTGAQSDSQTHPQSAPHSVINCEPAGHNYIDIFSSKIDENI